MNTPPLRSGDRARGRIGPATALLCALVAGPALSGCQTTGGGEASGGATYDSLMRLGDTTREQGDLFTAATLYRRAHAANRERAGALVALGGVLTDTGKPREALDAWRGALAIAPDDVEALRGYGRSLLALDQPAEAARQYAAVLETRPDDLRALNGLAVAKDMMGDHAGAQEQFRRALAVAPDDRTSLNNHGFSLILGRDYAGAIAVLEPLALAPSASTLFRQNLALAYGLAGREADAERLARLDLDEASVQRNLAYYRQARAIAAADPGTAMAPLVAAVPARPTPMAESAAPPAPVAPVAAPLPAAPLPAAAVAPPPVAAVAPQRDAGVTAPGPRPAPATPSHGGTRARVQVAAHGTEAAALRHWGLLTAEFPDLFDGLAPIVVPDGRPDRTEPLFHLRIAFADPDAAARFCEAMLQQRKECTVLHGRGRTAPAG
ncbi:tetratricopeptide repeat protein [Azospirillum sp. ST 5-10]|uniref:tetratricopeptide repeat protein n=1 Tax=unclassified Azospirillum TaxID=2630922 RepID=UPI003F4A6BE9